MDLLFFEQLGLGVYLLDLLKNNKGNHNPYHNSFHCLSVARACWEGSQAENLKEEDTRVLLIAAIYHDIHHSGGKSEDNVNIRNAIGYLKNVLLERD